MFGLSDGEKNHDANCLRFDTIPECDGRTDGRTDGQTDGHLCSGYTSACIACYANALGKSRERHTNASRRPAKSNVYTPYTLTAFTSHNSDKS